MLCSFLCAKKAIWHRLQVVYTQSEVFQICLCHCEANRYCRAQFRYRQSAYVITEVGLVLARMLDILDKVRVQVSQ